MQEGIDRYSISRSFQNADTQFVFAKDLLASAFGPAEYTGSQDGGLILLWTLKNPYHPIRTFRSRVGVTSLSFCTEHPQLLAAGMHSAALSLDTVNLKLTNIVSLWSIKDFMMEPWRFMMFGRQETPLLFDPRMVQKTTEMQYGALVG